MQSNLEEHYASLKEQEFQRIKILRLLISVEETSAPYNQFSLAWIDKQELTVCSFFPTKISVDKRIRFFNGDGSVLTFFRLLAQVFKEQYDIIHVHAPHVGLILLIYFVLKPRTNITQNTVFTVHNSYHNFKLRNKLLLLPIFAFFKKIVCCSQSSLESFPHLFKWLAGKRLCAVQNGVDLNRIDRIINVIKQPPNNEQFTIVTIGRLIAIKNPFTILAAFKSSIAATGNLVFIGQGNLHDSLLSEISLAHLEKQIHLTGLLPRDQVYRELLEADVFISASWGEGLPVATLEAMACGCPVILSDIAPHREIAAGTDFIPLIKSDDIAGFAREMQRFQKMSASQRAAIGQQCRKLVEEKFSLKAMHQGYEAVYTEVLGQ